MVERIVGKQFHDAEGVEHWRVLGNGASAFFATGTFGRGVVLVKAIGRLADAMGHHPDVDLRYEGVMVRLFTHDQQQLTDLDLALAKQISGVARALGIPADPSKVHSVQFAIDALDIAAVRPFWVAVLGYTESGEEDAIDPLRRLPNVWFQQMDGPRPGRNRIHFDVYVGRDQAAPRIAAALAAGGQMVNDSHAPDWWTLADAEGNEVDVAPWPDDLDPNRRWD